MCVSLKYIKRKSRCEMQMSPRRRKSCREMQICRTKNKYLGHHHTDTTILYYNNRVANAFRHFHPSSANTRPYSIFQHSRCRAGPFISSCGFSVPVYFVAPPPY